MGESKIRSLSRVTSRVLVSSSDVPTQDASLSIKFSPKIRQTKYYKSDSTFTKDCKHQSSRDMNPKLFKSGSIVLVHNILCMFSIRHDNKCPDTSPLPKQEPGRLSRKNCYGVFHKAGIRTLSQYSKQI